MCRSRVTASRRPSFSFGPSGQPTLQDLAQSLLQQIVNRLGVAAQETVDVD